MNNSSRNHVIFISGGSRSGKSRYAEMRAAQIPGKRTYIATCPLIDSEMEARIDRHRQQRSDQDWITVEEPLDLVRALQESKQSSVVLVDCLTLWVNNLLYEAQQDKRQITENEIGQLALQVAEACRIESRTIIFVTNELGMGLVPADQHSRLYRDLVGRCNQTLAAIADEVVFLVSGCPLTLRGEKINEPE